MPLPQIRSRHLKKLPQIRSQHLRKLPMEEMALKP